MDILEVTKQLRFQRVGMVQTLDQFVFCHTVCFCFCFCFCFCIVFPIASLFTFPLPPHFFFHTGDSAPLAKAARIDCLSLTFRRTHHILRTKWIYLLPHACMRKLFLFLFFSFFLSFFLYAPQVQSVHTSLLSIFFSLSLRFSFVSCLCGSLCNWFFCPFSRVTRYTRK